MSDKELTEAIRAHTEAIADLASQMKRNTDAASNIEVAQLKKYIADFTSPGYRSNPMPSTPPPGFAIPERIPRWRPVVVDPMSEVMPRTYTIPVAAEIAERYTEWTRIADLNVDWIKVGLREDGTADVWLCRGQDPPHDQPDP